MPRLVTEEEMLAHVKSWPRELERDVYGAYDPPLVTYNDFTLGKWPTSVVASYSDRWPIFAGNKVVGYEPPCRFQIHRELPPPEKVN
jgi:hypothetical protein